MPNITIGLMELCGVMSAATPCYAEERPEGVRERQCFCWASNLKLCRLPEIRKQRTWALHRPAGSKYVLKLDAVGIREENRVITGCVLGVLNRSIENGNSEIEEFFVKRVNRGTGRGSEGEVVKAGCVAIVGNG